MGVRGLQSFIENCVPEGVSQVNIKDIVETYKRETGRDAVIVVDTFSCMRPLYGQLDWICGGQVREYVEKFKTFIQAFTDLGVELVFFFDGSTQKRKRNVWVERRLRSLRDVETIFDQLSQGNVSPVDVNHQLFQLPPSTAHLASFAVKTSPGCKLYRTTKECDEEIAEYAVQNKCLAILGQDSDYIIYDGPQYYLSILHLNVQKMTTINYNRWALARYLQISVDMLPLLASLVGNDIVPYDDLTNFHQKICITKGRNSRPHLKAVIYSVAKYIRNTVRGSDIYSVLPSISRMAFGTEARASLLHLSVRSYIINPQPVPETEKIINEALLADSVVRWWSIQKKARKLFKEGNLDTMIHAVMHELPYESSTSLEDYRRADLPVSAVAYRSLRQNIYGIILFEKPGIHLTVEEWCVNGPDSLKNPEIVRVIRPEAVEHAGIVALWEKRDEATQSERWRMLAAAVSHRLRPDVLRTLPHALLVPALLLTYLAHELYPRFIQSWEVDAFIATALVLPTYDTTSLSHIRIQSIDPRAVHLACLYVRGASVMKMLFSALGNPVPNDKISTWYFFDGKLFHSIYLKAKSGQQAIALCENKVALLEEFNHLRDIISPEEDIDEVD